MQGTDVLQQDESTPAIAATDLKKHFADVQAVSGITLTVHHGELFGLLGPNGAGKTTTINMLTGLAGPDSGSIRLSGIDPERNRAAAQRLIGVVPDESNLYPELTGFENLIFCAALYGMGKTERTRRAHELLVDFGLTDAADRKFAAYSRGMKRKLTIAAGIIHRPQILFLDEPTTGIDVASARQLRGLVERLRGTGTTVLLTTHYIEEAERLCDRIAFIVAGRIVLTETVQRLLQPIQSRHVLEIDCDGTVGKVIEQLSLSFAGLKLTMASQNRIRIEDDQPIRVGPLVRALEDRGMEVSEARRIRPSLEDVFVEVTGIEAKAMAVSRGGDGR